MSVPTIEVACIWRASFSLRPRCNIFVVSWFGFLNLFDKTNGQDMKTEKHSGLKLYIFYCSNCFEGDALDRLFGEAEGDEHKIISLPCSGKATLLYFLKAFETGADGLALVTCANNECHYLEGNLRAPKRAEQANALLEEAGMGGNRVEVLRMNGKGTEEVVSRLKGFRERIRGMS